MVSSKINLFKIIQYNKFVATSKQAEGEFAPEQFMLILIWTR